MIVKPYRHKVDMTKYLEEHNFKFDNSFDQRSDNITVSVLGFDWEMNGYFMYRYIMHV